MMKKYILFSLSVVILSIASCNTASAQLRVGAKGGLDIDNSSFTFNDLNANSKLGFQVGPTLEYTYPASGLGAEISLLYGHKRYRFDENTSNADITNYNYVSIPINIKQRIRLSESFGLYFMGGFFANVKLNGGDITQEIKDVTKSYTSKNFMFGAGAGAGINLYKHLDIGIAFRGDLTDNYKKEYMDAGIFQNKKNQRWTLGVAYYF